ncbi:metallo-mystery pair system four-Cys motif protein [Alteromonas sediminis]|uniref:Metallo-mystery pair system four-Cys motif protein n=1 Tax=Alteromonas sediminis TaxID=2259342 RepID=A0A3N5YEM3_9ALTE|nr:MbnP family copper-binding protein [Alteromonas sediminis]RPJ68245.1 metallo-mystery pair system four-Cys motif protein [Alteromonas sediminis]
MIRNKRTYLTVFVIMVLFGLVACSRQPAVLTFVSDLHTPQICGALPKQPDYQVRQFTFYISGLELLIDEQWQPVDFFPTEYQAEHTAMIDLTPHCDDASVQTQVQVPLAVGYHHFSSAEAIRFAIGVPFTHNHKDPLTQPAPLNESSMFWSWQRGYKFLRWDLQHNDTGHGWSFHLGSVGCTSASALRAPTQPCSSPNQVTISMKKDSNDGYIFVEAQKLLNDVNLDNSTGCMFHLPEEADCQPLLNHIQQPWITWLNR